MGKANFWRNFRCSLSCERKVIEYKRFRFERFCATGAKINAISGREALSSSAIGQSAGLESRVCWRTHRAETMGRAGAAQPIPPSDTRRRVVTRPAKADGCDRVDGGPFVKFRPRMAEVKPHAATRSLLRHPLGRLFRRAVVESQAMDNRGEVACRNKIAPPSPGSGAYSGELLWKVRPWMAEVMSQDAKQPRITS